MRRRLYQLAIILASLFIINGLSRGLIELSAQDRRLGKAKQELAKLAERERQLQKQLEYFRSDEYVEKIARDKLLLAKQGETVLILPKQDENHKSDLPADQRAMSRERIVREAGDWQAKAGIINHISEDKSQEDLPNWQKWAKVFGLY